MILAHSSPPCSQMCRYSCPWTTLPCTSLSLLTWGCPCVAWRFSTNHWLLTSTTSLFLILPYNSLTPTTTTSSSPPCPAFPLPVALPVCGRLEYRLVSLSLLRIFHPSIMTLHPSFLLACEKAVYPSLIFLLQQIPPFACLFMFVFRFGFNFYLVCWERKFIVMLKYYAPLLPLYRYGHFIV